MKNIYLAIFLFSISSCNSDGGLIENQGIKKTDFIGDWTLIRKEENQYYKDTLRESRDKLFNNENIRITNSEISFYDYPVSFMSKTNYHKIDSTIYFGTLFGIERNIVSLDSNGRLILNRQFKNLRSWVEWLGNIDRTDFVYTFERNELDDDTLRFLEEQKFNPESLKSVWRFVSSGKPPVIMGLRNEILLDNSVMIKDSGSASSYHSEPYDDYINFKPTEFLNLADSNFAKINGDAIVYKDKEVSDFYKILQLRGDMLILQPTTKCLCDTTALKYKRLKN